MEAIRYLLKPVNNIITITLPENFSNEEVEVIVLPSVDKISDKKVKFDPEKFRGIWKKNNLVVETISKKMRNEWGKNISYSK